LVNARMAVSGSPVNRRRPFCYYIESVTQTSLTSWQGSGWNWAERMGI
jgi:hypothetical protein